MTFKNTLDAIKGEKTLIGEKYKVEVMPTPTSITKSCGISIIVDCEDLNLLKALIIDGKITVNHVYFMEDNVWKQEIDL